MDFELDDDFDLEIENGDFVIDETGDLDIELLLMTAPGNWKQNPLTGFGINNVINGPLSVAQAREYERQIMLQLIADGFQVQTLDVIVGDNNQLQDINIEASRNEP
jgi:hypothetical protein